MRFAGQGFREAPLQNNKQLALKFIRGFWLMALNWRIRDVILKIQLDFIISFI